MKLKRCPFCNSHDLKLEVGYATYQIGCLSCGAFGPASTQIAGACDYWNDGEPGSTSMVNTQRKYTNRDDLKEVELLKMDGV